VIGVTGKPPAAILYDWDQTLVDSFATISASLNETFVHFGLPEWTLAETRQRARKSIRDSFPELFGARAAEAADRFRAAFEARHLLNLSALPGAGDLVARVAKGGIGQAVVSNKTGRFLRKEAEHLGWAQHFAILVGAGDAAADKPDPAVIEMALEPLGLEPSPDIWFVGDTAIDMECALRSGCLPILIGDGHGDDYSKSPPYRRFSDLPQFTDALLQGIALVKQQKLPRS